MIIEQALKWGTKKLEKDSSSPLLDAEVLLAFVLKKNKEFLYSYNTGILTWWQKNTFKKLIGQRRKGKPVAYLTGNKQFFGIDFKVNKHTLIPRPETEILVETVIADYKDKKITLADIGTGSGAIAIALAKNLENAKIIATDISSKALGVAKKNAREKGFKKRIKFLRGDILQPIKKLNLKKWVLLANLPYLNIDHKNLLDSSDTRGLKFEPQIALYAGHDGLDLYRRLFLELKKLKNLPEKVYCETDRSQMDTFKKFVSETYPQAQLNIQTDLAGRDRILIVKF